MSLYLQRLYNQANVSPLGPPELRVKFYTGPVQDNATGEVLFFKAVIPNVGPSVLEDLNNEVNWNEEVRPHLNGNGTRIPETLRHASDFSWVLFEHLGEGQIREELLEDYLEKIARLCAKISSIPLGREPNGLQARLQNGLTRFTNKGFENPISTLALKLIQELAQNIDDSSALAGMVHGDINLKNLLAGGNLGEDVGIVDSEYGTLSTRPDWDKPRYHDAAYFYHLLHCQFHQPEFAEKFRAFFKKEIESLPDYDADSFDSEFDLCVLERTLSMDKYYAWRPDKNAPTEDPRRLAPGPYLDLIDSSLSAITL